MLAKELEGERIEQVAGTGCSMKDARSCAVLAEVKWFRAENRDDARAALRLGESACAMGDGLACFVFGLRTEKIAELQPDPELARGMFVRGCMLSSPAACARAAWMALDGMGGAQSDSDAQKLFRLECALEDRVPCPAADAVAAGKRPVMRCSEPQATIGKAMSVRQTRELMAAHASDLGTCYQAALKRIAQARNAPLQRNAIALSEVERVTGQGVITVFALDCDNSLSDVQVVDNSLEDLELNECVMKSIRKWDYPVGKAGVTFQVFIPMQFLLR